jgi:hypothetical protein
MFYKSASESKSGKIWQRAIQLLLEDSRPTGCDRSVLVLQTSGVWFMLIDSHANVVRYASSKVVE